MTVTRTQFAPPQTNPECTADRHGTANAAKEHCCQCAGAIKERDAQRGRDAATRRVQRGRETSEPERPAVEAARDWRNEAACRDRDPELWFPAGPRDPHIKEAKAICAECPPQDICLAEALASRDGFGIRGGLTASERDALLRAGPAEPELEEEEIEP